ncbi:MAG: hypothetical protein GYA58_07255 [Anaerolineaceae bacterium]|nr:hypothetical protein [Anaerolineaceae bacterium]
MKNGMKGFWKYFILLVVSALISLVGGIIGKTVVGYILFGVGLAAALAGLVYCFIKTEYFKADRRRPLILGLLLSVFLVAGVLLVTSSSRAAASFRSTAEYMQSANGTSASGTTSNNGSFSGNFSQGNFGGNGTDSRQSGNNGSTGNFGSFSGPTSGYSGSSRNTTGTGTRVLDTVLGVIFLAAGGIMLLIALIRFLTHKVDYKEHRWQTLLAGVLVGGLMAASVTLMVTHTTVRAMGTFPTGEMPGMAAQGTQSAVEGTASATQSAAEGTAEATATAVVTPTATATPAPTATATPETVSSLVVCLDPDYQWGINIRSEPSDTAKNIGTIPAGGCFTLDGRSAEDEGWYVMASGQNGMGSIVINADDTQQLLWVSDQNFDMSDSLSEFLAELPVVEASK